MGVKLVLTLKAPKRQSLAITLTAKVYQLCMVLFGYSARVLKPLDIMERHHYLMSWMKIALCDLIIALCQLNIQFGSLAITQVLCVHLRLHHVLSSSYAVTLGNDHVFFI